MNVTILGGLGHVGLPLSLQLAEVGHMVQIIDPDVEKQNLFYQNKAAFEEEGIEEAIENARDCIEISDDTIEHQVVIVATNNEDVLSIIEHSEFPDNHLWLIRQTVRPGTVREIYEHGYDVLYIPERLAQGKGLREIKEIPQIVGVPTNGVEETIDPVMKELFCWTKIKYLTLEEAELAKLFCNYFRYGTFALANDMYLISEKIGADFNRIRDVVRCDYPRMKSFPKAGFAGGFCLPKDTRYLSEYSKYASATDRINMGDFVRYIIDTIKSYVREEKTVGILGLSAKPNNDDTRCSVKTELLPLVEEYSMSEKIKTHDVFLESDSLGEVMECDVLAITTPHQLYSYLDYTGKELIDPWGVGKNE